MIDQDLQLRKILGVSIHKNMDARTMLTQWGKVSDTVKGKYPQLVILFDSLQQLLVLEATVLVAKTTAKKVYKDQQEVLETASAVTFAPSLAAAKLGDVVAQEAVDNQDAILSVFMSAAYGKLVDEILAP